MNISILDLTNDVYTIEVDSVVFGADQQFELEIISEDAENEEYVFEIRDFYTQTTQVTTPYSQAQNSESGIDPAKVLLWILKKIRERLCPECM